MHNNLIDIWVALPEIRPLSWWRKVTTRTDTADWLEPEGWWLRLSKCHCLTFTTNQSEKNPQVATLPANVAFTDFSLTVIREFESFEDKLPVLLAWRRNKHYFHSLQPNVSRLALLHVGKQNHVWLSIRLFTHIKLLNSKNNSVR